MYVFIIFCFLLYSRFSLTHIVLIIITFNKLFIFSIVVTATTLVVPSIFPPSHIFFSFFFSGWLLPNKELLADLGWAEIWHSKSLSLSQWANFFSLFGLLSNAYLPFYSKWHRFSKASYDEVFRARIVNNKIYLSTSMTNLYGNLFYLSNQLLFYHHIPTISIQQEQWSSSKSTWTKKN